MEDGAQINCRSLATGETPLMIICSHSVDPNNSQYFQAVNFIVDQNCDVALHDNYGMTALHHAAQVADAYKV